MTRKIVFTGKKVQLALDTVQLADGSSVEREVVVHPGAVAIIPLVDGEHVCMVRNRRHAVAETLLELPAGTRDANESPEQTAIRELEEETGYRAGRWRKLTEFYPSPGILNERLVLYVATDLKPGNTSLEPGEELTPMIISWQDAVRWSLDGTIRDAKSLVGILLWDRLREQERR
jgi:ADP-ribose pyrophosphatase